MRVLVTGGAGYIGSITAEELIRRGAEVTILDNLSQGHRAAVPPSADFVQGDLADRDLLDDLFSERSVDAVLHFAAYSLVGDSMQHPIRYLRGNLTNGLNLLEAMIQHGVKRFILSSTANLFGEPIRIPIEETEAIVPGSPYGESKFFLERILHWMDRIHGLRYVALRYFNAAGASETRGEDHNPETHLIPLVLQVALGKREEIVLYGHDYPTRDGTCIRDYIHVLDLAEAHILALDSLERQSGCYNVGNGLGYSVAEVIEMARRITGHPIPTVDGSRRAGDPATLVASSQGLQKALGWKPRYPELRDIMQSAWEWHRTHPDGYGDRCA